MKQSFTHSLSVQKIILRVDDSKYTSQEYRAGRFYPLIRLNDETFGPADILQFDLTVSIDTLLPKVHITIDDSASNKQDENFVKFGDVITIFVGSAIDSYHQPIKNDYYVVRADISNNVYDIEAILHVPNLYKTFNRCFENMTTSEVLGKIAKECNLGYITNMSTSNDSMNHIQFQPNYQFIENIRQRGYVDENTRTTVFIDQFANLVYCNLPTAISDSSETTTFVTDVEGQKLEKDAKFDLTNYQYGDENRANIAAYSSMFNEGMIATMSTSELHSTIFDTDTLQHSEVISTSKQKQLRDVSVFTSWKNANVFSQYLLAKQLNTNYNNHIFQRTKLHIALSNFYPQIYMLLHVHCNIYKTIKFVEKYSQDETITQDNFNEKIDTDNKSFKAELSNKTGNYMIYAINWSYSQTEDDERIQQNIKVLKVD